MERTVTKQVRLTRQEARQLRELARAAGRSESEILRSGIGLTQAGLERQARRRKAFDELIRLADEVPGTDTPFRLK